MDCGINDFNHYNGAVHHFHSFQSFDLFLRHNQLVLTDVIKLHPESGYCSFRVVCTAHLHNDGSMCSFDAIVEVHYKKVTLTESSIPHGTESRMTAGDKIEDEEIKSIPSEKSPPEHIDNTSEEMSFVDSQLNETDSGRSPQYSVECKCPQLVKHLQSTTTQASDDESNIKQEENFYTQTNFYDYSENNAETRGADVTDSFNKRCWVENRGQLYSKVYFNSGIQAWVAEMECFGKRRYKLFRLSKYESDVARKLALITKGKWMAAYDGGPHNDFSTSNHNFPNVDIKGVHFDNVHKGWWAVATGNYRQQSKFFSWKEFGDMGSKDMAMKCREKWEAEMTDTFQQLVVDDSDDVCVTSSDPKNLLEEDSKEYQSGHYDYGTAKTIFKNSRGLTSIDLDNKESIGVSKFDSSGHNNFSVFPDDNIKEYKPANSCSNQTSNDGMSYSSYVRGVYLDTRNNAWAATMGVNGKNLKRSFAVAKHGFVRAMQLAVEARSELVKTYSRENSADRMLKKDLVAKRLKAAEHLQSISERVKGVSFHSKQKKWMAQIMCNGRSVNRTFSVSVYGAEKAKALAVQCRREWETLIHNHRNSQGISKANISDIAASL